MIASAQVKAARKLLRWSQMKLAFEANVAPSTIVNIEGGKKRLSVLSVQTIKHALEKAGVEFPKGEPPRLKSAASMTSE
jgi:transcriptional regulator with XRE-family HTH domain